MSYAPFSGSARITTSTSLPADAVCFISVPNQAILYGAKAEPTEGRAQPSAGAVNKGRV
jgi:hypothetical protein